MSQGTALLWHGPCGHAAATARRCGPACECPARGSDLQGPAGRAASSALLTAWDMGLAHAVRLPGALHWDLRPSVVPSSLHQCRD